MWTNEQKKVIDIRDRNVLVSASAGSGKTAVLTERIVNLIDNDKADITEFLVFTFTKAAASEMKERIKKKLKEKTLSSDDRNHLLKQIKSMSSASVSTIHSFCNTLVRDNFFLLGIDPSFRILDEAETALIRSDVLTEVLERFYSGDDVDFYRLSESIGSDKDDNELRSMIHQLSRYLENKPDKEAYLEKALSMFNKRQVWEELLSTHLKGEMEVAISKARVAYEISEFNENAMVCIKSDLDMITAVSDNPMMIMETGKLEFKRYPTIRNLDEGERQTNDEIKSLRDSYKKQINKLADSYGAYGSFDEIFEEYEGTRWFVEKLVEVALAYDKALMEYKTENAVLTFSDLEALTLKALSIQDVADYYRKKYRFIFVDEYQDTNAVQEEIVNRLKRNANVFMVGDLKQSIYRFRLADPKIFIGKYNSFGPYGERDVRIDLNRNFRSREMVLKGINSIFEKLMIRDFGGFDYDDDASLKFGNESLRGKNYQNELMIIDASEGDKTEKELRAIGNRIHALVKEGFNYRDIAILMRSPRSFVEQAMKVFPEMGIPLFTDYTEMYLNTVEIMLLVDYLKILDNMKQDLPLLSVLRLPVYDFDENDFFIIRQASKEKKTFVESLLSFDGDERIVSKINGFLKQLSELRYKSKYLQPHALLHEISNAIGYEEYIYSMARGAERLANVRLLFELARSFEESTNYGIASFLNLIENIKSENRDLEGAKIASEESNVVRMMSIHKSKGLEFPVVFVAGMGKRYNEKDASSRVMFDDELGIVSDYISPEERYRKKTVMKLLTSLRTRDENRQEELRILYVAMTRAVDKLILTGTAKDLEKVKFSGNPHTHEIREANTYLSLIQLAIGENEKIFDIKFVDTGLAGIEAAMEETSVYKSLKFTDKRVNLEFSSAPSKVSVSEIVKGKEAKDAPPVITTYSGKSKSEAMEEGTNYHKIIQFVDLHAVRTGNLDNEVERLSQLGIVRKPNDMSPLYNFFNGKIGKLLLDNVESSRREQPFVLKGDNLVQGIIDLIIHTKDGAFVVDYKSDTSLSYLELYKEQVKIYARAVEEIKNIRVIGKYICFLRLDEVIEV